MTNVLLDRHHSDLFYSLQLLGDRLGWTLYTPIGTEWFESGYWAFDVPFDPGALAKQYLTLDARWTPVGDGLYEFTDLDHPNRPITGITLDAFRRMSWDYILATLQQNQWGFHQLAQETGARYLLQVGNTGQQIDWTLRPFVLNTSEMPQLGDGVTYHQEFSLDTFAFREPTETRRIASFVNLMPRITCWPVLERIRAGLPEFDFRIHGQDGEHGKIAGVHLIAEEMARSGWAWHDKTHGDGYGHVLFNWAAIGRPLIGHSSHYRGKMGAVFWRDLETCIDLDRHSEGEAVELIRAISADPERHRAMCHAIRAVFDAEVDFAAEAAQIKGALG